MRRFPLPEVPQGWKPDPTRVWNADPGKGKGKDVDKGKENRAAGKKGALTAATVCPVQL